MTPDFSDAKWPARFESLFVKGRLLLVDSAHNGDSVKRLFAEAASTFRAYDGVSFKGYRWRVIFGCGREKEGRDDMLQALVDASESIASITFVEAGIDRGPLPPQKGPTSASVLASDLENKKLSEKPLPKIISLPMPSTRAALDQALFLEVLEDNDSDGTLVCGSVYIAAEAREWALQTDPTCLPDDDWARLATQQ